MIHSESDRNPAAPRLVVVQEELPTYRKDFFEALGSAVEVAVLTPGKHAAGTDPHVRMQARGPLRSLHLSELIAHTEAALVLPYTPRHINLLRALRQRQRRGLTTVLWGHAYSRAQTYPALRSWHHQHRTTLPDRLRRLLARNCTALLVYTTDEVCALGDWPREYGIHIQAANNGLYSRKELGALSRDAPTSFLYVGRLVPEKRVDLVIHAFARARPALPANCRLVLCGDGSERDSLQTLAKETGVSDRIDFLPAEWNVLRLKEMHQSAFAHVSAGYAGLSIVQSLGWGVPFISFRTAQHAPEVGALLATGHGDLTSRSVHDLAEAMIRSTDTKYLEEGRLLGRAAAEHVARYHSLEAMLASWQRIGALT